MRGVLLLLLCPLMSGCMALGYPSVCKTPTIQLDEPDVHAFRVLCSFTLRGPFMICPIQASKVVQKMDVPDRAIAPQSDAYFSYSYLVFPLAAGSHEQSLEVLLYRRGYQLVTVPAVSWLRFAERSMRPTWKKVEKLEDAEKALESIDPSRWGQWFCSQELRQFLAREYAWLADSGWVAGPERKADRQRLLDTANEYRQQETAATK